MSVVGGCKGSNSSSCGIVISTAAAACDTRSLSHGVRCVCNDRMWGFINKRERELERERLFLCCCGFEIRERVKWRECDVCVYVYVCHMTSDETWHVVWKSRGFVSCFVLPNFRMSRDSMGSPTYIVPKPMYSQSVTICSWGVHVFYMNAYTFFTFPVLEIPKYTKHRIIQMINTSTQPRRQIKNYINWGSQIQKNLTEYKSQTSLTYGIQRM